MKHQKLLEAIGEHTNMLNCMTRILDDSLRGKYRKAFKNSLEQSARRFAKAMEEVSKSETSIDNTKQGDKND